MKPSPLVSKQLGMWPETVLLTWHEFRLICLDRVHPSDTINWRERIERYALTYPDAQPYLTRFGGYLGLRYGLEDSQYISNFPDRRGI